MELAEYVAAGEPNSVEYARLQAHLAICPACQETRDALRRVEQALWEWPLEPSPPHLTERILAAIEHEQPVGPWQILPRRVWLPTATLMAVMILALLLYPSLPADLPLIQWLQSLQSVSEEGLLQDTRSLWAFWVGCFAALAGIGVTLALVYGRMPDPWEIEYARHKVVQAFERLRRFASR